MSITNTNANYEELERLLDVAPSTISGSLPSVIIIDNEQGADILEAIVKHMEELDKEFEERFKEHQKKQVTQTVSANKPYYRRERW